MIWEIAIKAVWSIIFFAIIAVIHFLLVSWLRRRLRVRYEREHQINIYHKANFRAFYYVAVDAPQHPALCFCLTAGGLPLVEIAQPVVDKGTIVSPASVAKTTGKPAKTTSATQTPSSAPIGQQITDSSSKVVAKAGTLANLLGALAGLLPGSLGDGVKKRQEEIRLAQVNTAKAAQAPKQAQQRMTVLQSESQKLGVKPAPQQAIPAAANQTSPLTVTVNGASAPADDEPASADAPMNPLAHPFGGLYCVQTVELDPEQSLSLKLTISSTTGMPLAGSFAYNVHLQAVPLDYLQEKIPVLFRRGMAYFAPVAAWRSFTPNFVSLFAFLFGLLGWFYVLAILWQ